MMSVIKEIGRVGFERGRNAEELVARIVEEVLLSGQGPSWLNAYRRASKEEDLGRGIDAWIGTDVGNIPLQIKSSQKGVRKAQERYFRIPVVKIRIGDPDELNRQRVMTVIDERREELLALRKWE